MRSVELTFNELADQQIRTDWSVLAESNLPSLANHTSPSNSPHITLAAGAGLILDPGVQELWGGLPLVLQLSGVVIFGAGRGKYVLARSVVMSKALLELHAALHRHCTGAFANTAPDAWTPHITLARRISGQQLDTALAALDTRTEVRCTAARLWDSSTKTLSALPGQE